MNSRSANSLRQVILALRQVFEHHQVNQVLTKWIYTTWTSPRWLDPDFAEIKLKLLILFFLLVTIGSEFQFSEVKPDKTYWWRHQSRLQRSLSESQKILDLQNGWRFLILNYISGYLSLKRCPIFSPFLRNLLGRSGNSSWIEIIKNRESEDSGVKSF